MCDFSGTDGVVAALARLRKALDAVAEMPSSEGKAEEIKYLAGELGVLSDQAGGIRREVMVWLWQSRALSLRQVAEKTGVTYPAVQQAVKNKTRDKEG